MKITNIQKVTRQLESLIPEKYKTEISPSLVEFGINDLAITAKKPIEFEYEETTEEMDGHVISVLTPVDCMPDLTPEEIRIASYYAYRRYLIRLKDSLNRDAMSFKTMTLEINDLYRRVSAIDTMLLEVNRYINSIEASKCMGRAVQFGGFRKR